MLSCSAIDFIEKKRFFSIKTMEPETETVIDVEAEPIDNFEPDSTEEWYSAVQIQGLLRVSKAGLQQSISKFVSIYGFDIKTFRRAAARATEYLETALKAIKLLNASKFSELRNLVEKSPATFSVGSTTAIVFLDQHNQIATTAASVADSNLSQIASFKPTFRTPNWHIRGLRG